MAKNKKKETQLKFNFSYKPEIASFFRRITQFLDKTRTRNVSKDMIIEQMKDLMYYTRHAQDNADNVYNTGGDKKEDKDNKDKDSSGAGRQFNEEDYRKKVRLKRGVLKEIIANEQGFGKERLRKYFPETAKEAGRGKGERLGEKQGREMK